MNYNFLYTADSNYFNHMYLSIYSLLKNNDYSLTIHIIECDFTKEQFDKLERLFSLYSNATIKIYSINKLKNIMDRYAIPKWRGTDIANARLFSSEIVDTDRILYIDSDTIITSSLKEVFVTNVNYPISAVREMKIPNHVKDKLDSYYNSGILLIDYKLCSEIDFLKLIFDTLNNTLIYPDQDLLNIALNERIGILDPNYNMNPMVYNMIFKFSSLTEKYLDKISDSFYERKQLILSYQNPKIYHLIEYVHSRPWLTNNIHPFNKIYDQYVKEIFENNEKIGSNNMVDFILRNIPIFSDLWTLLEVMPLQEQLDVKNKIKKIIYFR